MPFRYTSTSDDNSVVDEPNDYFTYVNPPLKYNNTGADSYPAISPTTMAFMNAHSNQLPNMLNSDQDPFNDFPASFQIPPFMQSGPPPLAPGGGAEVIPAGMMRDTSRSWFYRNGFETPQIISSESNAQSSLRNVAPSQPDPSAFERQSQGVRNVYGYNENASTSNDYDEQQQSIPRGIYSGTGFDLLTVLAKLATRPNPTVKLGPVDMSSAFVVTDVRRPDNPLIYCSPNFYTMTGYSEKEVLGRNCRFLQSPMGNVQKGEQRGHGVNMESVASMEKACATHKELQIRILNYTKTGRAFENLVSIIPLFDTDNNGEVDAIYYVGVQVDLSHQPFAIAAKMQDGTYITDTQTALTLPTMMARANDGLQPGGSRAVKAFPPQRMAKEMQELMADPSLMPANHSYTEDKDSSHILSSILLAKMPDFIHVLSLKGTFLFVTPAITNILGYEPEEMLGESLAKFCHPADVVPVMRELKESSAIEGVGGSEKPRVVDLLFRAILKGGRYVWLECRGRLHVEPGKGRKAILLSARAREMSGPFSFPSPSLADEGEWWGSVDQRGRILTVNTNGLVGRTSKDVSGKIFSSFLASEQDKQNLENLLLRWNTHGLRDIKCRLRTQSNGEVDAHIRFWTSSPPPSNGDQHAVSAAPIIYQIRRTSSVLATPASMGPNVFREIDTKRNSSWQYELQQVRFENERLLNEVRALEHELGLIPPSPSRSRSATPKYSNTPLLAPKSTYQDLTLDTSVRTPQQQPSPWGSSWDSPISQPSLKRSWSDILNDDSGGYSPNTHRRSWNGTSDGGGG